MDLSIFFFSANGDSKESDKYKLILEVAQYADQNGYHAIWTPERHFQKFGGLYPNPSVLSAAISVRTQQIKIRAGSVTLPIHNPIRVAEEWAMVDNLSNGRAGVSFGTGWNKKDFILTNNKYENRKDIMFKSIGLIKKMWSGTPIQQENGEGKLIDILTYPKPIQKSIPIWITTSGNVETWKTAGEKGANILAALIGSSYKELEKKINLYKNEMRSHGHGEGKVTIMLHTFVGENNAEVKELVKAPLMKYLTDYMGQKEQTLNSEEINKVTEFAFQMYFERNAMLGDKEKCRKIIKQLENIGVDEIACLIDFGLAEEKIYEGLEYLTELKDSLV